MSTLRRIAAACALIAVTAMGLAMPADAGPRRDDAAASTGSQDLAVVAVTARRARGAAPELDGRRGASGRGPLGLLHALWLTSPSSLQPPPRFAPGVVRGAMGRPQATPLLASRTSRGPPARS